MQNDQSSQASGLIMLQQGWKVANKNYLDESKIVFLEWIATCFIRGVLIEILKVFGTLA